MRLYQVEQLNEQLAKGETTVRFEMEDDRVWIVFESKDKYWLVRFPIDFGSYDMLCEHAYYVPPEKFVEEYLKKTKVLHSYNSQFEHEEAVKTRLVKMIKEYIKLKEE